MTGYSPSAQARKLGLRPGLAVAMVDAPPLWMLDDPPLLDTVAPGEPADVVLLFLREAAGLADRVRAIAPSIFPSGALWTLWPRRAAGHRSDLGDGIIRSAVLPIGIVDVKVAAVDEDWSGLKFVWRLSER